MTDLSNKTVVVVGASRGLGHAMALAFAGAGAAVVAVARSHAQFPPPAAGPGSVRQELADAGEPGMAMRLLRRDDPDVVVLVAGAPPVMLPLQEQTWETFSVNWHSDVRVAFQWLQAALLTPLRDGSRVIVISSGAALAGSPLSGGYAGAKATQRIIAGYAEAEAAREHLGITFATVLPQFAPTTGVGRPAVQAYAAREGLPVDDYLRAQPFPMLTPEVAGEALVALVSAPADGFGGSYLLNGGGLRHLP